MTTVDKVNARKMGGLSARVYKGGESEKEE